MKKMKRFLSLLICMVMLMSVLPMGASAAEITQVVIDLPDTTNKDIDQAVASITATANAGTLRIAGDKNWVEENGEVKVSFLLYPRNNLGYDPDPEHFNWEKLKVVASGFEQDDLSYKVVDGSYGMKFLGITMNFPKPKQSYKITYMDGTTELTDLTPDKYTEGTTTTLAANPEYTKTGHTFGGWYDNSDLDGAAMTAILNTASGDKTFYAKWTPIEYPIEYNTDEGTLPNTAPETYTINDKIPLPVPTKTGHTFGGWYLNEQLSGDPVEAIAKGSTEKKTFYAKWTAYSYTVHFNANGGTGTMADQAFTYDVGQPLTENKFSKEGHTFAGWAKTADGAVAYTNGLTVSNLTDINGETVQLHAKWTANNYEYNVVYVSSTGVELGTDKVTKPFGSTHSISAPARDGYTAPESQNVTWDSTDAKTITFIYTPVEYDVTFDLAGGAGVSNRKYTIETDDFTLNHPTKENYDFLGWTGSNGTTADKTVTIAKGSHGHKSYVANWNATAFAITYDLVDGTVETPNLNSYTVETETFTLNNPTKLGYTFLGWTGSNGTEPQTTVTIEQGSTTGTKSYTANWSRDTYEITYDLVHGSLAEGVTNPGTYDVETETFTLNNPTKPGYTFLGWTGSNGETAQETVTIEKGTIGAKSYTANWKINQYTITFMDGEQKIDEITLNYGEEVTGVPGLPTKEGYTSAWDQEIPETMPAKDTTINVSWTVNQYTITFMDGEEKIDEITLNYGEEVTGVPELPTKEGYTSAWDQEIPETMPAKDTTINVSWRIDEYSITYKDGETVLEGLTPTTYTVEDETFDLPVLANSGDYTFVGWCENANLTGSAVSSIEKGTTGNKVFFAKWTETPVVANIDVEPDTAQMYPGDSLTFTAEVTVVGNISDKVEWSVAPANGIALLSDEEPIKINKNTGKLTANKPGNYIVTATSVVDRTVFGTAEVEVLPLLTVKFDTNGKGTAPKDQNLKAGEKAVKPADPTAANYTFGGWYTDKDCTIAYVFDTEVKTDITLYAKWNKIIYTVTYDANGGTGTMPVVNVEAGEGHTLVANEFKAPTGKTFKCWRVGLKDYKAGEKIDVTENVTVKAVWKNKTASSDLDYVPAAGDNFPILLWAGLLLFSVVALVEVVVLRRKRS